MDGLALYGSPVTTLSASPLPTYRPRYTHPVRRCLLLTIGASPTADFYLAGRLAQADWPWVQRDLRSDPPTVADLAPGTWVVITRYLTPAWAAALHQHADHLAGVAYLMDDELLDWRAWAGLPWGYRWRLHRWCWAHRADLRRLVSDYWFSTPELCARHPQLAPVRLPPWALPADACRPAADRLPAVPLLFYHGTRAHLAEMRWLRPVVEQVLACCPQLEFEAIGNGAVRRVFAGLPRTRVLPAMDWPAYLHHCRSLRGGIGLAPLLDSRFNAARSATRALDIARCGAVGVYADPGPYAEVIRSGDNGLLLPMQADRWVQAICTLVHDPVLRQRLRQAASGLQQQQPGPTLADLLRLPG